MTSRPIIAASRKAHGHHIFVPFVTFCAFLASYPGLGMLELALSRP